jgi:hypothetical protein
MRHIVAICFGGLLAAGVLSTEDHAVNGAQRLGSEQLIPPAIQNAPPQSPDDTAPLGIRPQPNAPRPGGFRRGFRPQLVPGQAPANAPGMMRPAPQAAPRRPLQSVFLIPAGLSMPPEDLYRILNYDPVSAIPLTPQSCFDIAYKCYVQEYYSDAIVFARHGLTMCNDARLHFLKGVCELHLARAADAERTAGEFRNAVSQEQFFGMEIAHERINETLSARFGEIVEYQNTGR